MSEISVDPDPCTHRHELTLKWRSDTENLIKLFDNCFADSFSTRLICGDDEPIYLPADQHYPYHRVVFAHSFFASALHEISHWCIAGERRRKEVDYGYWYAPDGRTAEQQRLFETVEVIPQALEWILAMAAGHRFTISVDNLSGEAIDSLPFKTAVVRQAQDYCKTGLSGRAAVFHSALCEHYQSDPVLRPEWFSLAALG